MIRILLIDDDIEVLKINQTYLKNEGFEVHSTNVPEKGVAIAKEKNPDCIILDIMMPKLSGYDVCRQIHNFNNTPIIFLTGKSSENDKINGLSLGADDYIVKPYSLRELKARINAVVRRFNQVSTTLNQASQLTCNDLIIDKLEHKAYYQGEDLQLTNREYEVLLFLAQHPNKEITFEELGYALFGSYQDSDRRSLMVLVSRLRKKFSGHPILENMIETIWSVGYKFTVK